ncbi:MAG: ATP-binding protein [Pseudomonadota bacterium]
MNSLYRRFVSLISRIGIATRLIILFGAVVAGLAAATAFITFDTERQVDALERVNDRLEVQRKLLELEAGIGAYIALLDARQSVVLNQDFAGLNTLKERLTTTRESIDQSLQSLSARGDVSGLMAEIETLREIHDRYLEHTIEASFVPALGAQRRFVEQQGKLRDLIERFDPDGGVDLSGLIAELDDTSEDIQVMVDLGIPAMIGAACIAFLVLLMSVWRPLRRLTDTIEELDAPDNSIDAHDDGPAEFRAIGRALRALQDRLRAQRAAEAQARESAEKLQQFTNATIDVLWQTGPDLRFNWVHARSANLGSIRERALGRTRWETVNADPETDPLWRLHREDLLARRPIRNFEYPGGQDDAAGRRWWRVSGEPFFDEDGTFQGYRGVSINISEQKRYEQRLRRAQNMEMLGRLTSGVAHDFNNLLTVLSSNLEMLNRHGMLEGAAKEMLARCERATRRGRKLSLQLLSLGHRPEMRPEWIDPLTFMLDVEELLRRTLPSSIEIETHYDDDLPQVVIDPGLLQDALLNLVINARDAMPSGGVVELTVARDAATLRIAVKDTGVGIEPTLRERVFEPFFTTKGDGKGTGLGLSMVHDFAVRSGGTVELESALGAGTTVTLTLPLPATGAGSAATEGADGEGPAAAVVLVEEDHDLRDTLRTILQVLGYDVRAFASAEDVLRAYNRPTPAADVLLCRPLKHREIGAEALTLALRAPGRSTALVLFVDAALEEEAEPLVARLNAKVARMPVVTDMLRETMRMALRSVR